MAAERTNISSDLVWQFTRKQNCFAVKRTGSGNPQLSRDPLNLQNKQSFKYAGYANNKAIGVQATEDGGVVATTKKTSNPQQPAKTFVNVKYGPKASNRKLAVCEHWLTREGTRIYKGVADLSAKNGYRGDIREDAVARVSAIRRSQQSKKDAPAPKLRGNKARKAAEKSSE